MRGPVPVSLLCLILLFPTYVVDGSKHKANLCSESLFWSPRKCIANFPGLAQAPIPLDPAPSQRQYEIPVYAIAFNNPTFVSMMVRQIDCYNSTVIIMNAG